MKRLETGFNGQKINTIIEKKFNKRSQIRKQDLI